MIIEAEQVKQYRRPITLQERRFLAGTTSNISLVARLHGEISEGGLKRAVDKMLVTYPLFGARVEDYEDVKWTTTQNSAKVPIKIYERESEVTWLSALNEEHSIPIKPSKGPLTRFVLVKGQETSELIVFCHHSISDGRSLELALREILLHLGDASREPLEVPEAPVHSPEIYPEGVSKSRIRSWFIGRINKTWAKEKTFFDEEDLENIWVSFWKNSRYGVECITLDEDETTRLVEVCRANDVTVNSALLVVLVRARIEALGSYGRKVNVGTAVDTRDRLRVDVGETVGLYAGGGMFKFDYKEDQTFWENVKNYHDLLQKQIRDNKIFGPLFDQFAMDPTLYDALIFAMIGKQVEPHQSRYQKISEFARRQTGLLAKYLDQMEDRIPDVITTNLGRLGIPEEVDGIKVESVFFTPSSGLKLEIASGIATAGGRLTITLNYHSGYFDGERIRKVRDRAEEILKEIVSQAK